MKASIAARLLHHQERKGRKSKNRDVLIPFTTEAEEILSPWLDALLKSGKSFTSFGKVITPDEVFIKCIGDCIALVASADAGEALAPTDLNEVNTDVALCIIEQLKKKGIVIE